MIALYEGFQEGSHELHTPCCNIKLLVFNQRRANHPVRRETCSAPLRGVASFGTQATSFPLLDLQEKSFWLRRYMPVLKDTKKTLQYLRELKRENHEIKLIFHLDITSDPTLPGAEL